MINAQTDRIIYKWPAIITSVALVMTAAAASFHRNTVYADYITLWTDTAAKSPLKSRAHNNLGNSYLLAGKYFSAVGEYEKALALDSNNIEAYYNIAICLDNVGLVNKAMQYYNVFAGRAPAEYYDQKKHALKRLGEFMREVKKSGKR